VYNIIDKPVACLGICHLIVFFMNKDELEIVGKYIRTIVGEKSAKKIIPAL
jgi:hypothetical protein